MAWAMLSLHCRAGGRAAGRHGVDADGRLHIGADCAVAIWLRTPGDAWLGRVLGLPGIRRVAGFVYDRFAAVLYAWNRRKRHW